MPTLIAQDAFAGPALNTSWTNQVTGGGVLLVNASGQLTAQYGAQPPLAGTAASVRLIATAFWNTPFSSTVSSNQTSELKLVNPKVFGGLNARIGVTVLASGSGTTRKFYEAVVIADGVASQTTQLNKWVDGQAFTLQFGSLQWSNGDLMQLSCATTATTTTLTLSQNGIARWTYVDSSFPLNSGKPGVLCTAGMFGDDWKAYNVGVAASPADAWIKSIAVNTWGTIPAGPKARLSNVDAEANSAVNQNFPVNSPTLYAGTAVWNQGGGDTSRIMSTWCGAAFDAAAGKLHIPLGQGHATNGKGNAGYWCDYNLASPEWKLVSLPSGSKGMELAGNVFCGTVVQEGSGVYSDNRIRASETYNFWIYWPNKGPVLAAQVGIACGGGPSREWWPTFFNPSTYVHRFGQAPSVVSGYSGGSGGAAAYDPTRNAMWRRRNGTTGIELLNITEQWSNVGPVLGLNGSVSLTCLNPTHDLLLLGNGIADRVGPTVQTVPGGWCVLDCMTGTPYYPRFLLNGVVAPANGTLPNGLVPGTCQPVWVPELGAALAWDNSSNTTQITKLTPGANPKVDDWTISFLPVNTSNNVVPTVAQGRGTYGRFFVWPEKKIAMVVNAIDDLTYFYRYGNY
jgi:hypothetical protein